MMEIFPAIDLQDGKCVRLKQGDFAAATIYDDEPLRTVKNFEAVGAKWLHVVDLDGAKTGEMQQFDLIAKMAQSTQMKLQVGGGIRTTELIERLLAAKVERVVIGSLAVKEPDLVRGWLEKFGPERIVLAFDIRLNMRGELEVQTQGWQRGSREYLWDVLKEYGDTGLKTILCTDVSRDGMLEGANQSLYYVLRERCPHLQILASGGVRDQADLQALAGLGVHGAIVGKAIYEGRIDLGAVIQLLSHLKKS